MKKTFFTLLLGLTFVLSTTAKSFDNDVGEDVKIELNQSVESLNATPVVAINVMSVDDITVCYGFNSTLGAQFTVDSRHFVSTFLDNKFRYKQERYRYLFSNEIYNPPLRKNDTYLSSYSMASMSL